MVRILVRGIAAIIASTVVVALDECEPVPCEQETRLTWLLVPEPL